METDKIINRDNSRKNWMSIGLAWGLIMFITMDLIYPFFSGDGLTWKNTLIAIPVWTIAGLGFGYTMKLFKNQSDNKYSNQQ